ncbi:MAG: type II toxin-antitoxin system RelE/ParE family toxin [Acidobacteria bacterium]|nr:type II toxin-antitoxin system RelE/ParE family toxin [Acidobacteriota bacterium]
MADVRWTPQAADDLEAICLFIARDSPRIAAVFADRVLRATDRLAHHPRLGRVVPELRNEDVREIIVSSYRVIYRIRQGQVHLLTIHHGARSLDTQRMTSE